MKIIKHSPNCPDHRHPFTNIAGNKFIIRSLSLIIPTPPARGGTRLLLLTYTRYRRCCLEMLIQMEWLDGLGIKPDDSGQGQSWWNNNENIRRDLSGGTILLPSRRHPPLPHLPTCLNTTAAGAFSQDAVPTSPRSREEAFASQTQYKHEYLLIYGGAYQVGRQRINNTISTRWASGWSLLLNNRRRNNLLSYSPILGGGGNLYQPTHQLECLSYVAQSLSVIAGWLTSWWPRAAG